jgi:hypothetical protein
VAGSCDQSNELSGSIKDGKFPDKLRLLLGSQEGLFFIELVNIAFEH